MTVNITATLPVPDLRALGRPCSFARQAWTPETVRIPGCPAGFRLDIKPTRHRGGGPSTVWAQPEPRWVSHAASTRRACLSTSTGGVKTLSSHPRAQGTNSGVSQKYVEEIVVMKAKTKKSISLVFECFPSKEHFPSKKIVFWRWGLCFRILVSQVSRTRPL